MTVFRVQVNYTRGSTGKWSNVWHVDAADLLTAATVFETQGVPDLLPILDNTAQIASLLTSDPATNAFITTPINAAGTSSASGDLLPLFNSLKAFFPSPTFGRPDYKYFKGFVTESVQTNGDLNSGTVTAVEALLATLISDMDTNSAPLVSINGEAYASANVQVAVQMRQMHRKRKKTPTP